MRLNLTYRNRSINAIYTTWEYLWELLCVNHSNIFEIIPSTYISVYLVALYLAKCCCNLFLLKGGGLITDNYQHFKLWEINLREQKVHLIFEAIQLSSNPWL